jgi:integrase
LGGWIETRGDRYRARFRIPNGDGETVGETFTRRRDAKAWLAKQERDAARGAWIDPRDAKVRFGAWAREWQAAQLHHRETTAKTTASRLDAHIMPTFGRMPLGSISRVRVQAWVRELSQRLAPSTVEASYRLLAQIMLAAVDEGMIATSPCRKISLPERVFEPPTIPTAAELAAIAQHLPACYRRIVAVAAGSGLREGELFGLTVDRINFLHRTLTVDRQLQTLRAGRVFVPVKRPASNRVVPVAEPTLNVLSTQIEEYPPDALGLVFRNTHNRPLARQGFQDQFAKAARSVGVSCTFHDIRHFYASGLLRAGLSPVTVAERLGHSDGGKTVMETYAHVWHDDDQRTRAAVEAMLSEVG